MGLEITSRPVSTQFTMHQTFSTSPHEIPTGYQTGTMTDDYLLYLEVMAGASVEETGLLDMKLSEKSEVEAAAAAAAAGV